MRGDRAKSGENANMMTIPKERFDFRLMRGIGSPLSALSSKPCPPSPESLSKKVVRGGIWVFALRITNRGLGFVRTIILARLLAPHDFGLLGIAMLAIATLETFSQTGFQAASNLDAAVLNG